MTQCSQCGRETDDNNFECSTLCFECTNVVIKKWIEDWKISEQASNNNRKRIRDQIEAKTTM